MFYSVYVCSSIFSLRTGCFVYLMVICSGLVVLAVLYALYILHVWEAYVYGVYNLCRQHVCVFACVTVFVHRES